MAPPPASTSFYDILGLSSDASPEDIRKAYKKRALATHPDRNPDLPKATAEERFREVSNAYEVLNDSEKRMLYDKHGVWPPPTAPPPPPRGASPFSSRPTASSFGGFEPAGFGFSSPFPPDPFFASPFPFGSHSHPRGPPIFVLHDPFEIFATVFGDHAHSPLGSPPFHSPFGPPPGSSSMFPPSPSPFSMFHSAFGQPPPSMHGGMFEPVIPSFVADPELDSEYVPPPAKKGWGQSSSTFRTFSISSSGRTSTEQTTKIVNGVTTTEERRRDADGNEHVTTTFPDGSKRYRLNGRDAPLPPLEPAPVPRRHSKAGRPVIPRQVTLDDLLSQPSDWVDPLPAVDPVSPYGSVPHVDPEAMLNYPGGYAPRYDDGRSPYGSHGPSGPYYHPPPEDPRKRQQEQEYAEYIERERLQADLARQADERGRQRAELERARERDRIERERWEAEGRKNGWIPGEDEQGSERRGYERRGSWWPWKK